MEFLKRENSVVVDIHGIDPLLDKAYPNILKVEDFEYHQISEEEEERPDLISYRNFGSVDYWWVLLVYNKMTRVENLKKGLIIKIPSLRDAGARALSNKPLKRSVSF